MLTVAPLASGQAKYYLSLASSAASYYVDEKGIEPAGTWYGPCAAEFGLSGVVQAEHLSRLCEGFDPHNPEKNLVRNAGSEKRAHGTDLCYSAPKSVSAAWALASPELREAIERAMHRAVRDALDFIQDKCGVARTGAQGLRIERVPLMFARFEHSSSRAGDAQLHVHCVCPNATRHVDGRTTAIDPTGFYHHMMSGGAVFRASFAEYLRELGFEIERDKSSFRIKGFSTELCERISTRRAEILEVLFERCKSLARLKGYSEAEILKATSGRMAELVNLETRKAKRERSRAEVFEETRNIARELGLPVNYVEGLLSPQKKLSPEQKAEIKEEIFASAVQKISDQHSHWNERDLTEVLAQEAQGSGLDGRDVRELVQHKLSGRELVRIGELVTEQKDESRGVWRDRSEERFTTPLILRREGEMLASVSRMSRESVGVPVAIVRGAIEKTARELAAEGKKLSREQVKAVAELTAKDGRIACLEGIAGTSKSTILGACRLAWERAGKIVLGCAVAGVASDALRESSGIESDTLAMILTRLKHGRLTLTKNHVVVLDEAGMVPTTLMAELVEHVDRAGAKLVLAGDQGQIQAINAGGPFGSICGRISNVAKLTEIHRQRETWRKETVVQFSKGEAKEALTTYLAKGQLHVTPTRDEAVSRVVELWKEQGGVSRETAKHVFVVAPLNCDTRSINRLCQQERLRAGEISERNITLGGQKIHEHDRIVLTKKDRGLKVENGFTGEVVSIDDQGQDRQITVRLDKGNRLLTIPVEAYGADRIKPAYASTVHLSQGSTRESVIVLLGGHMMDRHLSYVAASRSRGETHLVCDHAEVGKDPTLKDAIRTMARAMSRDRTKDLATDLIDRNRRVPEMPRVQPQPERVKHRERDLSLGL
jgi:conjugative relaxase-like TrwC/TraI family protein